MSIAGHHNTGMPQLWCFMKAFYVIFVEISGSGQDWLKWNTVLARGRTTAIKHPFLYMYMYKVQTTSIFRCLLFTDYEYRCMYFVSLARDFIFLLHLYHDWLGLKKSWNFWKNYVESHGLECYNIQPYMYMTCTVSLHQSALTLKDRSQRHHTTLNSAFKTIPGWTKIS